MSIDDPIRRAASEAWRPPEELTPWEWCDKHLQAEPGSPMPGRFRSSNSPWIRAPMEAWADNNVLDIAIQCSAQSSKTTLAIGAMAWAIAEDPGRAQWVTANEDNAKEDVRDRIGPMFESCEPVANLTLVANELDFVFRTMPLYFVGAHSKAKLQSKPIRWLVLDEARNYPPGALELVLKRTRAFWNSRRALISTAMNENDAVHRAYLAGSQEVFNVPCPACGLLQPLKFDGLCAAHPETGEAVKFSAVPGARDESGNWDFDILAPHIRYQCAGPECRYLIRDTPQERKALARGGRYVAMNPKAPRNRRSFHWNALLPPWVSWRSIVEEFIAAEAAARQGQLEPLKAFIRETCGEPWRDQLGEIDDFDHLKACCEDYDFGEEWAEEITRFMSADKQARHGEHYWWVIRAFGPFGKSRLIAYGKCNTKAELEKIRADYNVEVGNAVIDSGYKASEVYRFCLATGWKPMKGDDAPYFLVMVTKPNGKKVSVRKMWRKVQVDTHQGLQKDKRIGMKSRPIWLYQWSNDAIKDLLAEYQAQLVGGWTLPKCIGRDYLRQMDSEKREAVTDSRDRVKYVWKQTREENHIRDCELQIKVAAVASKVLLVMPKAEKPENN